jgi:hypothetical protein
MSRGMLGRHGVLRLWLGVMVMLAGWVRPAAAQRVALTTERLREIVRQEGISAADGVQFNRDAGRAFQNVALRSLDLPENFKRFTSPIRGNETRTAAKPVDVVIPDAVSGVREREVRTDEPIPLVREYDDSSFIEVKATRKGIRLSSSRHQILGLLDALARSPAKDAKYIRPAIIFFVITSDTQIAREVIDKATQLRIALWQITAYELKTPTPGPAQLQLGPAMLLTPKTLPDTVPTGGGFLPPQPLPKGLPPSTNIDPTTVNEE